MTTLEAKVDRMEEDICANEKAVKEQGTVVTSLSTDRAKVVAGAWVANGLTCFFVAGFLWLGSRMLATEAQAYRTKLIEDIRTEMSVKH